MVCLLFSGILLAMYLAGLFASYFQTKLMGSIGQRMLFTLRNTIFKKLQSLPVAFFNANKAGDLISRVNNDTDKLNTFFSQSLDAVYWKHRNHDRCWYFPVTDQF